MSDRKSVLFVQTGNFGDAYRRFAEGGAETYRDQRASVDFVAGLAPAAKVTTFALGAETYRDELAANLWSMGGTRAAMRTDQISGLFDETGVTHLIMRTPHVGFLQEAARRGTFVLPSFADMFAKGGPRTRYGNWTLRRALQKCQTPCFSNHSLSASRSLVEVLGLAPERVVPMDRNKLPLGGEAKTGVADPLAPKAFYAGVLSEEKGVGDCFEAIAMLRKDGVTLSMSLAGRGDMAKWQARADMLGIGEQITFLDTIPNAQVRTEMRAHDFVIVPSRHSYAEGLPNTLCEGLVSRSVVVISDHPAFAKRLQADKDCLIFPAGNAAALAACLQRGISDRDLYARLSQNAPAAHDQLYIGMEWTALVTAFLDDPKDHTGWVAPNSLKTLVPDLDAG